MGLLRKFENLVLENEFKINYISNCLNIINYLDISHFDNNKIMVNYKDGIVTVLGKNLVVSRLVSDELLIEGSIDKIEFR